MTLSELIAAVAAEAGQSKDATEHVIKALGTVTQTALKSGGDVILPGLGKFSIVAKAARVGRNPKTGAELQIAAKNAPKFKAGKALLDSLA